MHVTLWQILIPVGIMAVGTGLRVLIAEKRRAWFMVGVGSLAIVVGWWLAPGGDAGAPPPQQARSAVTNSPNSNVVQNSPGANVTVNNYYNTLVREEELARSRLIKDYPAGYKLLYATGGNDLYSPPEPVGVPITVAINWSSMKLLGINPEMLIFRVPDVQSFSARNWFHHNSKTVPRARGARVPLLTDGVSFRLTLEVLKDEPDGVVLVVGANLLNGGAPAVN